MNKINCLALLWLLCTSNQLLANTISGNISTSLQEDQLEQGQLIFTDAQFTASDDVFIGDYIIISSNITSTSWSISSVGDDLTQISFNQDTGLINYSGVHSATLTITDDFSIKISFTEFATAEIINSIIQHIELQYTSNISELKIGFNYVDLSGVISRPDFINYYPELEFYENGGSPFDTINVGNSSKPAFVDIDNDGDKDLFIGEIEGFIHFFENTGTSSEAKFTQKTGLSNPFDRVDVTSWAMPTFVDIDNDGDQDAFIGSYLAGVYYFENIGTPNVPSFKQVPEDENPMAPINEIDYSHGENPSFVDIDNDGDFDLLYGTSTGGSRLFKNMGTQSKPNFVFTTSTPFGGLDVGTDSALAFVDIDGDADFDAYVGTGYGTIRFLENTGSTNNASFSLTTGIYDLFVSVDVGESATPAFVDIDNDGDMDAVVGEAHGSLNFFENTSAFIFEVIETNDAPVIYETSAPTTVSSTFIQAYTISDEEGDNFSLNLTGDDSQIFSVELISGTAQIHTESTLTFDLPIDADSNNEYLLTLVAVDVHNAKTEFPINLKINAPVEKTSEDPEPKEVTTEGPGVITLDGGHHPDPAPAPAPKPGGDLPSPSGNQSSTESSGGSFNYLLLTLLLLIRLKTRISHPK